MALSKAKKAEVVKEVSDLLASSKMTVVASYPGTTVKSLQALRRLARDGNTTVRVVKNRLVIQALSQNDRLKSVDTGLLTGQLLYAFNPTDESAPAKALADFSKKNPSLSFVGAIDYDGYLMGADEVKSLASLPSKDQLRAQLAATLNAPLSGFVNVLAGNVRGVLNVLGARASSLES